jgi:hypothetical protein
MKKILIALVVVLLGVAGWIAWMILQPLPDGLDLRTNKPTDNALYTVRFLPRDGEPAVGPISVWHVELRDRSGTAVTGAEVLVDGGMPRHGHGLPTSPASQGEITPGVYAIDGMKFSMRGWWEFKLFIKADAGEDTVTFNTVLE